MSQNPFDYTRPTLLENFYGRWSLVDKLIYDLTKPRANSWAVIGGRRFGKSSVLKAVEQRMLQQVVKRQMGEPMLFPLVVDLKRCTTTSEQHVYACILNYLHMSIDSPSLTIDIGQTKLDKLLSKEPEYLSFFNFEKALLNLQKIFEKQEIPWRLVLLLDEVEHVTEYAWSETLFNQLRALIHDGPLADIVVLILTGSAKVMKVRQSGSPLLNALKLEHLATLAPGAIDQLMAQGKPLSEDVAAAIHQQCGGHPYIAQYLLHHLWDGDWGQATFGQVEEMAHQMHRECSQTLIGWSNAIGENGRVAYRRLIEANDEVNEQAIIQLAPDMQHGLDALRYHGLVMYAPTTRRYRCGGELFRQWFEDHQSIPSIESSKLEELSPSSIHYHIEKIDKFVGGDDVGQDKVGGDKVKRDKISGDKQTIGNIRDATVATGRAAQLSQQSTTAD